MRRTIQFILFFLITAGSATVPAQLTPVEDAEPALIPVEERQPTKKRVTAVYGVTADDYLPTEKYSASDYIRPKVKRRVSRPVFDLPDAFYFIGGPIFLLILLRVLVIFINGFEEKRKEEENQVASEHFNPE
ncbi:hypothetical protein P4E94_07675 [Pontiellaceae bacterium B12219]|nr:hypothetical protein [Pontiellaceae bacterium B12219]